MAPCSATWWDCRFCWLCYASLRSFHFLMVCHHFMLFSSRLIHWFCWYIDCGYSAQSLWNSIRLFLASISQSIWVACVKYKLDYFVSDIALWFLLEYWMLRPFFFFIWDSDCGYILHAQFELEFTLLNLFFGFYWLVTVLIIFVYVSHLKLLTSFPANYILVYGLWISSFKIIE